MAGKDVVGACLDCAGDHLQRNNQHVPEARLERGHTFLLGCGQRRHGQGQGPVHTQRANHPQDTSQHNRACGPGRADQAYANDREDHRGHDKEVGGPNVDSGGDHIKASVSQEHLGVPSLDPAVVRELIAEGHANADEAKVEKGTDKATRLRVGESIPSAVVRV